MTSNVSNTFPKKLHIFHWFIHGVIILIVQYYNSMVYIATNSNVSCFRVEVAMTSKLRSLIIVIFTTSYRKVKTDILHCSLDENISLNMQSQSKERLNVRPVYKRSMCKISLPKPKQILYGIFELSNISQLISRTYFHNVKIF